MEQAIRDVRLPKSIIPLNYTLNYEDIDLKKWTFSGYVDIVLDIKEESDFIMLNAKELSITKATYTLNEKEVEINTIVLLKREERVVLKLEEMLPIGNCSIHIEFSGVLNDYMQGFYRSKYVVDGEEKYMATTQFESTDARMALPCWDEPALKARFNVHMTVPLHYTAVSNMQVVRKDTIVRNGEKKHYYEFAETPIMSTYLLAFVVGEFDVISGVSSNGITVNTYAPLGKSEWASFALKVGLHAISFYADFFNVPYPLPKLDLLPIPDFAAGAMENWGCVTFREVDLLIDEKTASIANKQRVSLVVSHEIAHMWFGDLVTMEWWTHLWLNEGFASYMEYLCVDNLFPEWNMFLDFYDDSVCTAYVEDALPSTHPIEVPVKTPDEIDQIFDGISYNKGSTVINMLVSFIGLDAFRKGMAIYLNRHSYSNTCTEDLWRALEEGSGIECESIMKKWTQDPGYPILLLKEEEDGSISSSQRNYLSNPNQKSEHSHWDIPLAIITEEGIEQFLYNDESKQAFDSKITKLKKEGKWVKINRNTLCLVYYPASMLTLLSQHLSSLSVLDRIQLLRDMKRLCNSKHMTPSMLLDFMRHFDQEKNAAVIATISSILYSLHSYVDAKNELVLQRYKEYTASLLKDCFELYGWDEKEGEDCFITSSRASVISTLSNVCNDEVIKKEAVRRFGLYMKGDTELCHTEIRSVCFQEGIKSCSEEEAKEMVNTMMKMYDTTTGAEKRRIIISLGQSQYVSVLDMVLDMSVNGRVRKQDTYSCFGSVVRNQRHNKICWKYLKDHLNELRESLKQSFNMLGYFVSAGASVLDEEKEYEDFMAFFANRSQLKEISRSISSAEQTILLNIARKEFITRDIEAYFSQ